MDQIQQTSQREGEAQHARTKPAARLDYVFNRDRGWRACGPLDLSLRPFRDRGLERGGDRGVVSDRPILPKPDNQQIWIGPGLCLLVLVNSSNYPDFLRLLFAMARDVLLAGNATTVPADESHSCLSATAVLSADDFSLDSGAD
jgi:hypothetical protein